MVRDYDSSAIYMYNSVTHFHLLIQHSYTQTNAESINLYKQINDALIVKILDYHRMSFAFMRGIMRLLELELQESRHIG